MALPNPETYRHLIEQGIGNITTTARQNPEIEYPHLLAQLNRVPRPGRPGAPLILVHPRHEAEVLAALAEVPGVEVRGSQLIEPGAVFLAHGGAPSSFPFLGGGGLAQMLAREFAPANPAPEEDADAAYFDDNNQSLYSQIPDVRYQSAIERELDTGGLTFEQALDALNAHRGQRQKGENPV